MLIEGLRAEEVEQRAVSAPAEPANRWHIAIAGVFMQIAFGAVYAWSVFRVPLAKQFGWSISQVTLTFTTAIFCLGFAAFFGGLWINRKGPRVVAMTGGALYGLGVFLASFSDHGLAWLYLSYGVIGGVGLGLGYIVPVAVLVKWFPDRRGLITGIAVGGFGVGALVTAPLAIHLIHTIGVLQTFAYLGMGYAIITVAAGSFMRNPPDGWVPAGWSPKTPLKGSRSMKDYSLGEALRQWQWWALWLLLFIDVTAGISIISQEAPMFQELTHISSAQAAGLVGIVSIGNALGRVWWAWISDLLSRRLTFVMIFALQAGLFWVYPELHTIAAVGTVTFVVLMCYGGGFGTMPAFCADYFGSKNMGPIYGLMLTAWSFASVFGPLLIAHLREVSHAYRGGLHIIAAVLAVSIVLPLLVRPPKHV